MNDKLRIRTERLVLRPWQDNDLPAFAQINADPAVMKHFPATMDRSESDALAKRIRQHMEKHGFGLWAVELPVAEPFIGFVGLSIPKFEADFMPNVEIGWRIAPAHWGYGYATEGAEAALDFGFTKLKLPEIVSFTVPENVQSRRVMEKIGLRHFPAQDFDHPALPAGHPLQRHVLYRLTRAEWVRRSD